MQKAAKLIGRIVDAATNKRIQNATVTLRHAGSSDNLYSTTVGSKGVFEILAPTVPFTIEVSAPGYKKWRYKEAGSTSQTDALHLAPTDTKKINILLNRIG